MPQDLRAVCCSHRSPSHQLGGFIPVYQIKHNQTGSIEEVVLPIADRDNIPKGYTRITVPVHIGWVGCRENPHTVDFKSKGALRDMEIKYGADKVARDSGFSVKTLQDTWLKAPSIAAASGDE